MTPLGIEVELRELYSHGRVGKFIPSLKSDKAKQCLMFGEVNDVGVAVEEEDEVELRYLTSTMSAKSNYALPRFFL